MYDIVTIEYKFDSVFVTAFHDIKETIILNRLDEHGKKEDTKSLFKKITSLHFLLPTNPLLEPRRSIIECRRKQFLYNNHISIFNPNNLFRPPII
jgi:hypothetical protein